MMSEGNKDSGQEKQKEDSLPVMGMEESTENATEEEKLPASVLPEEPFTTSSQKSFHLSFLLPDDTFLNLFSFLAEPEVRHARKVCRNWKAVAQNTDALRKTVLRDRFIIRDILFFNSITLSDPTSQHWPLRAYFTWQGFEFREGFALGFTQFHFQVRRWLSEELDNKDQVMAEFYPELIQTSILADSFLYRELTWLMQEGQTLQSFCEELIQRSAHTDEYPEGIDYRRLQVFHQRQQKMQKIIADTLVVGRLVKRVPFVDIVRRLDRYQGHEYGLPYTGKVIFVLANIVQYEDELIYFPTPTLFSDTSRHYLLQKLSRAQIFFLGRFNSQAGLVEGTLQEKYAVLKHVLAYQAHTSNEYVMLSYNEKNEIYFELAAFVLLSSEAMQHLTDEDLFSLAKEIWIENIDPSVSEEEKQDSSAYTFANLIKANPALAQRLEKNQGLLWYRLGMIETKDFVSLILNDTRVWKDVLTPERLAEIVIEHCDKHKSVLKNPELIKKIVPALTTEQGDGLSRELDQLIQEEGLNDVLQETQKVLQQAGFQSSYRLPTTVFSHYSIQAEPTPAAVPSTPTVVSLPTASLTPSTPPAPAWSLRKIAFCILLILLFLGGFFFFGAGIAATVTTGGVLFIPQQLAPLAIVGGFFLSALSGFLGWKYLRTEPPLLHTPSSESLLPPRDRTSSIETSVNYTAPPLTHYQTFSSQPTDPLHTSHSMV